MRFTPDERGEAWAQEGDLARRMGPFGRAISMVPPVRGGRTKHFSTLRHRRNRRDRRRVRPMKGRYFLFGLVVVVGSLTSGCAEWWNGPPKQSPQAAKDDAIEAAAEP